MKCLLPLLLTVLLAVMVRQIYGEELSQELAPEAETTEFAIRCGVDEEENVEEMESAILAMNQPPDNARVHFPDLETSKEANEPLPTPKIVI